MSEQREAIENAIWDNVDEGTFDHSVNAASVVAAITDAILALPQGPVGCQIAPDARCIINFEDNSVPDAHIDNVQDAKRTLEKMRDNWTCRMFVDFEALSPCLTADQGPVGWRDISTAPKDGTVILVWHVTKLNEYAAFDVNIKKAQWLTYAEEWRIEGVGGNVPPELTHWRPLPAAPGQPEQPSVAEAARVLLDAMPNYAMERGALESQATDDEGQFASLSDLLDFSGENKAHTVVREAICAALRTLTQEAE